ncbi:MAG TPA: hypothetical protein VJY54_11210 [Lachnospiraceae bacterium]|nr:hypothetical protein [Lachnospiraceae bacterium]
MGVWLSAKGELEVTPAVDDELIRDFIHFSEYTCPDKYWDEKFINTWFFNSENKLICHEGKFAEPSIWYEHLRKNFFEPRGYSLIGDPQIIGECDEGFQELVSEREVEYQVWKQRKELLKIK